MSGIFGYIGIEEANADRTYVNQVGQEIIYAGIQEELARHNADLDAAIAFLVEETTTATTRRYKLPGGGYLQSRGGYAPQANVKGLASWDTAFPLSDFGAAVSINDIAIAYMSIAELNRHLDTVEAQDINTVRREMFVSLFNNGTWDFEDEFAGTLTVRPLANGDAVEYPPVIGGDDRATDDHYLETGYLIANISDINNPFTLVEGELEEHFGYPAGGSPIVLFLPPAATPKVQALTDFIEVTPTILNPASTISTLQQLPAGLPGRLLGAVGSVWAVEWRSLPATHGFGIHLGAPKPLIRRVDPPEVGLGAGGLDLVAKNPFYPFETSYYRHRFGFGAGNRLNGVVLEFGTGGTYTVPTTLVRT